MCIISFFFTLKYIMLKNVMHGIKKVKKKKKFFLTDKLDKIQ